MKTTVLFAMLALGISAFAGELWKDLPDDVVSGGTDKVIQLTPEKFYFNSKNAKRADDSSAVEGKTNVWTVPEGKNVYKGFAGAGVYDAPSKKVCVYNKLANLEQDGKYHWYKVGKAVIGENSTLYITDWSIVASLKEYYAAGTPNEYEIWVSLKVSGPEYVSNATGASRISMDRAVLVKAE